VKLVSQIKIREFRSIRDSKDSLDSIGNFSAFAGLNNSGKSNVLRSLNAFFTGYTDINSAINFKNDFNRYDLRRKKHNKSIDISMKFDLPANFRFREKLQGIESFLGHNFTITKKWYRDASVPDYFLNDKDKKLDLEHRQKIDQFLALINFRYIPNRVLPIDIIKNEHQALRDVLVRRLGREAKASGETFEKIQRISSNLIRNLSDRLQKMKIGSGRVRLATPKDWADMIFAFGYRLGDGRTEVEDIAQGSGIQSLLMLETLYLIDKDYFQQFGWRQASIWAIEEPESSLHCSLEAQVASFLREVSSIELNRLQIFATTHSEIILQYSDKSFYVENRKSETNFNGGLSVKDILMESSKAGISKYLHPIIYHPTEPILIVDGKYDLSFFENAINLISPKASIKVFCLENFDSEKSGGEKDIYTYLRNNRNAILCRTVNTPVVVVLDWESKDFEKYNVLAKDMENRLIVFQWPVDGANPRLTKNFKGIERFYPDRLIEIANNKNPEKIGKTTSGNKYTIHSDDYGGIKKTLYEEIEANGLKEEDMQYVRDFILKILDKLKS